MAGRSVAQLESDYPDTNWRKKFVSFTDLMEILGDCTISDTYIISDKINAAIKLSESGQSILSQLTRKGEVKAKDARLMCALTLGHEDLFVDIDATDLDQLGEAIHDSLINHSIRFPFIHGRNLYDAYAENFESEKELLTNEETMRLLESLPDGVFQYGEYTVGPFGLRKSLSSRSISAARRVPAYHCSVTSCQSIHPVTLQTGYNATVNRDREKIANLLGDESEPSEWWEFAAKASGISRAYYGDRKAGVLLPLLGDTLTDDELRALVSHLLNFTKGSLRGATSEFLIAGDADELVAPMDRAQLLQLTLIAREDDVASSIDALVRREVIPVKVGDVRRPIMNRGARTGAFGLRAELGHHGIRFVSADAGLALLRQRRLLRSLYVRDDATGSDAQELEWQLRGIEVDDLDEKMEHFFHSQPPEAALRRLVLARKSNLITACHEVGLELAEEMDDEEIVQTLMWKLGFAIHANDDPHSDFWARHERLTALTQSSSMGTSAKFLETASPYFAQLEGLLLDSLAFTTWALLNDHVSSASPFTYDDEEDRLSGLSVLEGMYKTGAPFFPNFTGQRVELRNLMEGFRTLAKHLNDLRNDRPNYERAKEEFPEFDGKTDLKEFIFKSTTPFLDLTKPSQDRIVAGLNQIASTLTTANVNEVRNDYAHFRRTAPSITRFEEALDAVRLSVTRIENLGFCRLLYSPAGVSIDRWGQKRHDFAGPRSYEHTFMRPTTLDWMGLPDLSKPQLLVRSASFGDPNEVLRFTPRFQSDFSRMWEGFPNRRRRGPGAPAPEEASSHGDQAKVAS